MVRLYLIKLSFREKKLSKETMLLALTDSFLKTKLAFSNNFLPILIENLFKMFDTPFGYLLVLHCWPLFKIK